MTKLKFTHEPKEYRTREGKKVRAMLHPFRVDRLLCDDDILRDSNGCWVFDACGNRPDIVAEWREPVRVSGWVNVYENATLGTFKSRQDADKNAYANRIACIHVSGVEGQEPGE